MDHVHHVLTSRPAGHGRSGDSPLDAASSIQTRGKQPSSSGTSGLGRGEGAGRLKLWKPMTRSLLPHVSSSSPVAAGWG